MPPQVQSLNDIVAGIRNAQAPQQQQLDTSIGQNESAGAGQTAGLNAAEDNAFRSITQGAVNRGGYFSGFAPDAQAHYTGSTYLPALAKLQTTIAATRDSLLGKKADLAATANGQGLSELHRQQGELTSYNNAQATARATAQAAADRNATTIAAAQIHAGATLGASANRQPTVAEQKAAAQSALQQDVLHAFNGFNVRPSFYTEHAILPQLINSYSGSGLTPKEITDAVYGTRKALGYG